MDCFCLSWDGNELYVSHNKSSLKLLDLNLVLCCLGHGWCGFRDLSETKLAVSEQLLWDRRNERVVAHLTRQELDQPAQRRTCVSQGRSSGCSSDQKRTRSNSAAKNMCCSRQIKWLLIWPDKQMANINLYGLGFLWIAFLLINFWSTLRQRPRLSVYAATVTRSWSVCRSVTFVGQERTSCLRSIEFGSRERRDRFLKMEGSRIRFAMLAWSFVE